MTRSRSALPCLVVALLFSSACDSVTGFFMEPKPNIDTPTRYKKRGLVFDYPSNWEITDESAESISGVRIRSITIQSKGDAMVSFQSFAPPTEIDLSEYTESFVEGMTTEAQEITKGFLRQTDNEEATFTDTFFGSPREGRRAEVHLRMLGERISVVVESRTATLDDRSVVMVTYITKEGRKRAAPGFDLVRSSLRVRPTK